MSDQAPEAVNQPEVSVEDRIAEKLFGPEEATEPPQEDVEDEPEATDEEAEEPETEEESEDEEEPEEAEEFEEIEWNGQQKKLTKAELKELAQKGFDYTQKTQEVAEHRRALEVQQQAFVAQATLQAQVMEQFGQAKALEAQLSQYKAIDWDGLMSQDPVQAMRLDRQYRELQAQYQGVLQGMNTSWSQAESIRDEQRQTALREASQKLLDILPEWRNPDVASKEKAEVMQFLAKAGYSPEEIGMATDPRAIAIARKAAKYDALMAKKGQDKRVQNLPKPVKPGAAVTKADKQAQSDHDYKRALKSAKSPAEKQALIQQRLESKFR